MRQLCCCLSTFVTCKSKHPLSKICYFCVLWYTRWWRNYRNQVVLTVIYNPQNCTVRRWNHHKKMQADNGASINMVNLACLTIFRICCCVIIYKPHILLLSCQFVLCLYNDCLSSWYCTLFIISGCFGILSYLILYSTSQCCWTSILEMEWLLASQKGLCSLKLVTRMYLVQILSGVLAIQVCYSSDSFNFLLLYSFSEGYVKCYIA